MSKRILVERLALAAALSFSAGAASGQSGYVTTTGGTIVRSGTGLCWHTRAWTPQFAVPQCERVPVVHVAPPRPAKLAAAPAAEPKAAPAAEPKAPPAAPRTQAPVVRRVTLATDLMFDFDSARLRPAGRAELEALAKQIAGAEIVRVTAEGHADRIGSEDYNVALSQRRVQAVEDALVELGIAAKRVDVAGKGESEPLTGEQCNGRSGASLIACLQADRRVEIEARGRLPR